MKKSKKLMIAAMAAVTAGVAGAAGTSTFAWFSMNDKVSATGLNLVAKSDNTFLLISKEKTTATEIQTENAITTAFTVADPKVYPAAPASADSAAYLTTSGKTVDGANITTAGVEVKDQATAAAVTNWYTANAETSSAATMLAGSARQLTDFAGYVITQHVYLTVAKGANPAKDLKVTPTFKKIDETKSDITVIKAIVATSDGGFKALSSADDGKPVDIAQTTNKLTDSTVWTVDIYLYVDGNAEKVYTNNSDKLAGVTVDFGFSVTAEKAA